MRNIAIAVMCAAGFSADAAPMSGGDPELVAIVAHEYQSIDEFLDALIHLTAALTERHDARAPFAAAYRVLTVHAKTVIASGAFDDPAWGERLALTFGNLYRQAFYDYETGNLAAVPLAWRVAFDAAERDSVTVFQHALLGIHAHVNRDLAHALAAVTPPDERAMRYHDFVVTNELVVGAILDIEFVLGHEFAPPLVEFDAALGDFDAELLRVVLTQWRYQAWRNAQLFDGRLPTAFESFWGYALEVRTWRMARIMATGDRLPS